MGDIIKKYEELKEERRQRELGLAPQEPEYLTENDLWYMTLDEIEVFKREYQRYRANVKLVREFSERRKQLIIKF